MEPSFFLFDHEHIEKTGQCVVEYALPFSDLTSLPEGRRQKLLEKKTPLEFGHTLEQQIGGQLKAGFIITAHIQGGAFGQN